MLILAALLMQLATTPSQLRRVWDADQPTPFPVPLPVRVQSSVYGGGERTLAPDGSRVEPLDLCGAPQATGGWRDWIGSPSESSGGYGSANFSRDGSIAVLCNRTVRHPFLFVRRFDLESRRFIGAEYRSMERFHEYVYGRSSIACFAAVNREHVLGVATSLRVDRIRATEDGLRVETCWQGESYSVVANAVMNDAGTIVALVAKRGVSSPRLPFDEEWSLLIVPDGGTPSVHPVEDIQDESHVAVSENGQWVAISRSGTARSAIETLDVRNEMRSVGQAALESGSKHSIWDLAISDEGVLAVVAYEWLGVMLGNQKVLLLRTPHQIETITRFDRSDDVAMLHFFGDRYLYVGQGGLPGLTQMGIDGGPDTAIPLVPPTACVYRY